MNLNRFWTVNCLNHFPETTTTWWLSRPGNTRSPGAKVGPLRPPVLKKPWIHGLILGKIYRNMIYHDSWYIMLYIYIYIRIGWYHEIYNKYSMWGFRIFFPVSNSVEVGRGEKHLSPRHWCHNGGNLVPNRYKTIPLEIDRIRNGFRILLRDIEKPVPKN